MLSCFVSLYPERERGRYRYTVRINGKKSRRRRAELILSVLGERCTYSAGRTPGF